MLKIVLILHLAFGAVEEDVEVKTTVEEFAQSAMEKPKACVFPDTTFAIHKAMTIGGKNYDAGTEVYIDDEGNAIAFTGGNRDAAIDMGMRADQFKCDEITVVEVDPETGESKPYNIPLDFQMAGKAKPKKRGGTTHCYRAVKAKVAHKIKLTGVAAYMAAPQLRKAGWRETKNYGSAPNGSICVFAAGGKKTASGGHKYGHIGIKGTSGITNPKAGFDLKRPFIGCFYK